MDRNMYPNQQLSQPVKSPPARVAWIETVNGQNAVDCVDGVATREGGVDRNSIFTASLKSSVLVATREGGVDRNEVSETYAAAGAARRHPRGWRG